MWKECCAAADLLCCCDRISSGLKIPILHLYQVSLPTWVSKTFRLTENNLFSFHLGLLAQTLYDTMIPYFLALWFFAKTGVCPRLGSPLQMSTQPHCCRLLKPTPWLLCRLGEFEGPFQTPGTSLGEKPYNASKYKYRYHTVFRTFSFRLPVPPPRMAAHGRI